MCLVAIAWRAHPRYPLVIAGNRDEFHERPTAPAGWWEDAAVFGGRDLVAGGSWLAASRAGRFAVIINNPRRAPEPGQAASRGHLVRDFVAGDKPSGRFLDAVQARAGRYAGFCLLAGSAVQVRGLVSPAGAHPARWTLPAGVSAFSNAPLEEPWPKVGYLREALSSWLAGETPDPSHLFDILARRQPVDAPAGHDHPVSLTPFVVGERYGTRATTVVTLDDQGHCEFEERRFGPGGRAEGSVRERFSVGS